MVRNAIIREPSDLGLAMKGFKVREMDDTEYGERWLRPLEKWQTDSS